MKIYFLTKSLSLCSAFFQQGDHKIYATTHYFFDLELPKSFQPFNNDGEVDEFELVPCNELIKLITTPEVAPGSAKVMLDFLIRKGYIDFETGK